MTVRITAGLLLLAAVSWQPAAASQASSSMRVQRICAVLSQLAEIENANHALRLAQFQHKQFLTLAASELDGSSPIFAALPPVAFASALTVKAPSQQSARQEKRATRPQSPRAP